MSWLALIVGLGFVPFLDPAVSHWLRVRWRARSMLPAIAASQREERSRESDTRLAMCYRELGVLRARARGGYRPTEAVNPRTVRPPPGPSAVRPSLALSPGVHPGSPGTASVDLAARWRRSRGCPS